MQEARPDGMPSMRQTVYWEPSIGAIEPSSVEVESDHPSFHSVEIPPYRRSLGRRVFRTLGYGLTVIVIGGAVSAWYSSDDNAKGMVEASLRQLSSIMGATSSANSDVQSLSKSSDHALGAIGLSGELENRLETVVNDLAVMRRTAEQLAAKQEAMARDIAVLQAVERTVSEKLSSLPQLTAALGTPRKNASSIVQSEATAQPAAVPLPIARPVVPQRPE